MQKGSIEWLKNIASILGTQLLGIEMSDHRECEVSVSPVVQVSFVIPMYKDYVPANVAACRQIEGHRGLFYGQRGNKPIYFMSFDFNEGPFPTVEDIIEVAKEFGLTVRDKDLNSEYPIHCALPEMH